MKPESLLESDPINIYLARKPKMPTRVLDETPNGDYGLVISGYSLVGSTELPLCSSVPSHSILGPTLLRETKPLLYFMSHPSPLLWVTLP